MHRSKKGRSVVLRPESALAALKWIKRSLEVTAGQGSAHSYSLIWGWEKGYPETTGYLIETLYNYSNILNDPSCKIHARHCADWLCSLQFADGAFPALLAGSNKPSVFNTTQILFGLARACREEAPENPESAGNYRTAIQRAADWLVQTADSGGGWKQAAYVPGFEPTYYTRAIWGLLQAADLVNCSKLKPLMELSLNRYAERFLPNNNVRDWGFFPGQPAFTHTIAYTLEGFWHSALLLNRQDVLAETLRTTDRFLEICKINKKTPGRVGADWQADNSFICLTGNAQLASWLFDVYKHTGEYRYQTAAIGFLTEIIPLQYLGSDRNRYGALSGSQPVWGPYLRFRYPNWAVKFFLDALGKLEN